MVYDLATAWSCPPLFAWFASLLNPSLSSEKSRGRLGGGPERGAEFSNSRIKVSAFIWEHLNLKTDNLITFPFPLSSAFAVQNLFFILRPPATLAFRILALM